jgi:hypothetical protein
MKIHKIILFIPFILLTSCEKIASDAPDCIEDLIRHHKGDLHLCETSASVKQYSFQGQYVYVFDPGNCGADMGADVYNESCDKLGMLGGIAGNLTINGERFDQKAKYIKTIWTD